MFRRSGILAIVVMTLFCGGVQASPNKIYWRIFMKNIFSKVFLRLVVGLILVYSSISCATGGSSQASVAPYRPLGEIPGARIIDTLGGNITLSAFLDTAGINQAAYTALLQTARNEYQGEIDVYDVTWVRLSFDQSTSMCVYSVNGNVVLIDRVARDQATAKSSAVAGVEGALARAADQAVQNVPQRSRIAIVYITAIDRNTTDFIAGELEYIWVNKGYALVDRSQLDKLRQEQHFQLSGEVDDETAVSIGKFAGADIIITGRVDGEGNLRRLRLRALNTQTAQVVGAASERL
jgi:hypothetical protein